MLKVGDLIKIADHDHMAGVHPVGIITELVAEDGLSTVMVLYMDGDYEELVYDTEYEVISESR